MTKKINSFTTTTTANRGNILNNKIPKSKSGFIKLTLNDFPDEKDEKGLGIELEINREQIEDLGHLIGKLSLKEKRVATTLDILKDIVEIAEISQKVQKIIQRRMDKLEEEYQTLSTEEKLKYSSAIEYIEQKLPELNIEEKFEKEEQKNN